MRALDGEGIAGQPGGQVIGFLSRLLQPVKTADARHWAERLLIEQPRVERHVGQHSGRPEIARFADPPTASQHRGTPRDGILLKLDHCGEPTRIGERPHLRILSKPVADL